MFLNADGRLTETGQISRVTTSGRLFQMVGPATGKAVVVSPDTGGWRRRRVFVEHPAGHLQVLGQARHGLVERQTSVHVRREVVLEDARYGRQGAVSSLSPVRAAEDAAVFDWRQVGQLQQQGCSGAGTRGTASPHFLDRGGHVPNSPPPLFGLKFVQKLIQCCNWLHTETQCKIISVQPN